MGERIYEFIHRFEISLPAPHAPRTWTVRVWSPTDYSFHPPKQQQDRLTLCQEALTYLSSSAVPTTGELAKHLALHTSLVNAVEVTNEEGQGCLVYNDWP